MNFLAELPQAGHLLIIGMGRSGVAAAHAARRVLPDVEVVLSDIRDDVPAEDEAPALAAAGVRLEPGRDDGGLLDGCGLIVKSPGVPVDIPLLKQARARHIPVWGEVEFAWRFLPNPFVGVTGTNGKTTTTELIGHILNAAGRPCSVAGNMGTALSTLVGRSKEDEILVVELSSFQLEDSVRLRPNIAVLLNLTEDHLDRHPAAEQYFSSKKRIFENQQHDDVAVVNLDDPNCRGPLPGRAQAVWFSRLRAGGEAAVYARDGVIRADLARLREASGPVMKRTGRKGPGSGEISPEAGAGREARIVSWPECALKGQHNLENALAAAAATLCLGLVPEEVGAGLRSFPGVKHRLQEVRVVDGVTYVNDSKATNVDAAIKALSAYEAGIHLILGGSLKGCSFDPLAEEASADKVKEIILIGESADEMARSFARRQREVVRAGKLDRAVEAAGRSAVPGDVVLLAPACASFDQYQNYEERGEHFISLVNSLKERAHGG